MNPITDPDKFGWVMDCPQCYVASTFRASMLIRGSCICNSCGNVVSHETLKARGRHELKEEFQTEGLRRTGKFSWVDRKTGAWLTTPQIAEGLRRTIGKQLEDVE